MIGEGEALDILTWGALALALPAAGFGCLLWLLFQDKLFGFSSRFRFLPGQDRSEPPLWSGLDVFLGIVLFIFGQLIFPVLIAQLAGSDALSTGAELLLSSIGSTMLLVLFIVSRVGGKLAQPYQTLGLARTPLSNLAMTLLVYAVAFIPLVFLSSLWQILLRVSFSMEFPAQEAVEVFRSAARARDWMSLGMLGFVAVVLAPVSEELLFRGLLYGWIRARWGPWLGALLCGGLFALVHFSVSSFGPLCALGMLLCAIVEKTRSLYPAMFFHAVFNFVSTSVLILGSLAGPPR